MFSSCFYCGISLQRATQCVAIVDIILGVLNYSFVAVEIPPWQMKENHGRTKMDSSFLFVAFLPALRRIPYGLVVTVVICYAIQLFMGGVLYVATVNRHRGAILLWMIMTAITALFTGLVLRLCEILIVNEFYRELKYEQDESETSDSDLATASDRGAAGESGVSNTWRTYLNLNTISTISGNQSQNINPNYDYDGNNFLDFEIPPPSYEYTLRNAPPLPPHDIQPPPRYEDIDIPLKEACSSICIISEQGGACHQPEPPPQNEETVNQINSNSTSDVGNASRRLSNSQISGSCAPVPRENVALVSRLFPEQDDFSYSFWMV